MRLIALFAVLALPVVANAALLNDGTTTANLVTETNVAPAGTTHTTTVTPGGGVLAAYTMEDPTTNNSSAKGIWYSTTAVNTTDYYVAADFLPYADNGRYRGGVVGWYDASAYDAGANPTGQTGIGLYVKPGSSFRIRTMRFGVEGDANNEDSGLYLYDASGNAVSGSGIDFSLSGYDTSTFANFELAFAEGTVGDGFIDVVATITQGANTWTKEFKTDLPVPADHRLGYLAYAGTSPGDDVGSLDNLSSSVPEPASMSVLALGALALVRRRRN